MFLPNLLQNTALAPWAITRQQKDMAKTDPRRLTGGKLEICSDRVQLDTVQEIGMKDQERWIVLFL